MLKAKISIFTILLLIISASVLSIKAQSLANAEADFADLVVRADEEFDSNDNESAEDYISDANQLLIQYPGINDFLKGHFNKVRGKLYMQSSPTIALSYFNTALTQFTGNSLEIAETKMFIGIAYYHANNYTSAQYYFEQAETVFESTGDMQKLAQVLNNLGVLYYQLSDEENAVLLCNASLSINTEIENTLNAGRNQQNLAFFAAYGFTEFDEESLENLLNSLGGGTGGSSSGIKTSGGGTVVVSSGS